MVLDGDPAYPRKKRPSSPNFRPISVAAIRLDDQDDTWHGGRPRPVHIVLDWDPAPVHRKGGTASNIMSIASGDTVRWDAAAPKRAQSPNFLPLPIGTKVGVASCHIVLVSRGPNSSTRGGGRSAPAFGPCLLWPNGWMDQGGNWHGDRPRPRPHFARWGPGCPLQKRGHPLPKYHVYCGQTAGCIRIPLGTEVGLGLCHIVRWGPSSPRKGHRPPIFGQCLLWPNGSIAIELSTHGTFYLILYSLHHQLIILK